MNYLRRIEGKKRARRLLRIYRASSSENSLSTGFYNYDGRFAHTLLKTRVPCSCPMCGNPRRHFGQRTVQELRADNAVE